jgi:hypothetical protein
MLEELRAYAVPVLIGSAVIYVSVAWAKTIKIHEA